MDINVKVTIGAEPELIMHLATLVECVKDVLKVSNSQLAAAEPVKPEPAKRKAKPAEKKQELVKEEAPAPAAEAPAPEPPKPEPEPEPVPTPAAKPEPAPEPAKEESPAISEADIRKFCMEFVKKDPANKAKVVAAFKSVGATKLPEVKPEDYRKVMDMLK